MTGLLNEILAIWGDWLRPSAGLPTVQWSILLAVAAAVGHLLHRHTGLPKVVGYSMVGALAGLGGFSGAAWPLQGIALYKRPDLRGKVSGNAQNWRFLVVDDPVRLLDENLRPAEAVVA